MVRAHNLEQAAIPKASQYRYNALVIEKHLVLLVAHWWARRWSNRLCRIPGFAECIARSPSRFMEGRLEGRCRNFHAVRLIVCQGTVNEVTFDGITSPIRIALKVGSFESITAISKVVMLTISCRLCIREVQASNRRKDRSG